MDVGVELKECARTLAIFQLSSSQQLHCIVGNAGLHKEGGHMTTKMIYGSVFCLFGRQTLVQCECSAKWAEYFIKGASYWVDALVWKFRTCEEELNNHGVKCYNVLGISRLMCGARKGRSASKTWSLNNLSLQHPQIQKESQYIKYLCCDDAWTLNLWVTGIRIAKVNSTLSSAFINRKHSPSETVRLLPSQYGASLHENYKTAKRKTAIGSVLTNRSTPSSSNPSTPSPTIKGSAAHTQAAPVSLLWWLCCMLTRGVSSFSAAAKAPSQANGHAPKPQPGPVPQVQLWRDHGVKMWKMATSLLNVAQENFKYIQLEMIFKKLTKWHYTCVSNFFFQYQLPKCDYFLHHIWQKNEKRTCEIIRWLNKNKNTGLLQLQPGLN